MSKCGFVVLWFDILTALQESVYTNIIPTNGLPLAQRSRGSSERPLLF